MANSPKLRIVFMGTPDFAAIILRALVAWPCADVVAAYSQPDRPAGRGYKLQIPAVKRLALEFGLPVFQPLRLDNSADLRTLADFEPDVLAVAAYGMILPDTVLSLPRLEPLNVHASLLPLYRGAAPMQRAIMDSWRGDAVTGVSVMRIVRRLDSGPVFAACKVPVSGHTFGSLHDLLAEEGARLLLHVLDDLLKGTASACDQDDATATYAAKITRQDRHIFWDRPAAAVHAHIRALTPRPGARASFLFHALSAPLAFTLSPGISGELLQGQKPGSLFLEGDTLKVACADRWYTVSRLRPEGGRDMPVRDFVNGYLRNAALPECGVAVTSG
ncbi:MAG: methionyl-tRNA formyltransferase [Desulfovibrio sp.]|nr:methionyl-tRNA formyltransferase [Desulfovibrio sp.]